MGVYPERIDEWAYTLGMEHFAVVLALSRMALHADAKRSAHQIERLRDALVAEGEHRQAAMISGLLERWDSGGDPDQPPMRLEPMRGRRMELTQAVTLGLKERGKADRQSKTALQ